MAKFPKLKYKKRYEIVFQDHAMFDKTVECCIVGLYLRSSDRCHTFTWWHVRGDEETFLANLEEVSIVKGAILSIRLI